MVHHHYDLNVDLNQCPCGARKPAAACCMRAGGYFLPPRSARTKPPHPVTGYSNPKCYAAALRDCSERMSSEHPVSKSVLKCIHRTGSLTVSGMAWQQVGDEKALSPEALGTKVLCSRHNSALHELDSLALRLFKALDQVNA